MALVFLVSLGSVGLAAHGLLGGALGEIGLVSRRPRLGRQAVRVLGVLEKKVTAKSGQSFS